jgi:hypothetical protein
MLLEGVVRQFTRIRLCSARRVEFLTSCIKIPKPDPSLSTTTTPFDSITTPLHSSLKLAINLPI